ncbi:MAG TPA: FTR1 family protein, partial [Bacillales bacterium]|nr:FTR1 family protein [Bacillales bacterium]
MRLIIKLGIIGLFLTFFMQPAYAAGPHKLESFAEKAENHAGQQDFQAVKQDLDAFHEEWESVEDSVKDKSPSAYQSIESAYSTAVAAVSADNPDADEVKDAVRALEGSVERYIDGVSETTASSNRPGAKTLLSLTHELDEVGEYAESNQWTKAREEFDAFHEGWEGIEDGIRSADHEAYEHIETNMGMLTAELNSDSPKAAKVEQTLEKLNHSIDQYADGDAVSSDNGKESLSTLIKRLDRAQSAIAIKNAEKARASMTEFIQVWPTVDGQVKTRSAEAYTDTENRMTKALSLLSGNPPNFNEAKQVVSAMQSQLTPLAENASYSFWDAAIILLREGLEIILILAALLSFLKKTNNSEKRTWIWGGAGAGLLVSIGLAFALTSLLSAAAAGAERELLEGITGLIAVVVMFTVGSWLHNKSNIVSWNKFINEKVGTALARGSLWSLGFVSFLTVVREGAESIIFYLGIAPDISTTQLVAGMATAVAILFVIGFAIIKFSVKLPIGGLFLGITVLIYYLAVKFTGQSIHALQVVDKVPADPVSHFPSIEWLGVYPTWETLLAQVVLLLLIAGQTVLTARKKKVMRERAMMESKREHR